ncbi:hypothetical protein D9756_005594 [Leucocoprinus leucothites]|uniref:Ketoreductase (KR) domain-containing protein n=1 Tax=Leucocoprinus leucothites TaxID=201217 RepID=A0A8H5D7H8_9AGAR|nr:hypothetical protein D9756_005594 [Leucoagaricus leucothites]
MVLKVAQALADRFFPYEYAWHILIALVTLTALRTFSQGRTTNRERDLHDRTFMVTGGFTPLGLTLLQNLAQRGAKIVALSPYPIDSPAVTILVSLLRTTYNNDNIYAERCNLSDPDSIRSFCMRFLTEGETEDDKSKPQSKHESKDSPQPTGKEKPKAKTDSRLDGIIFAHEYQHIGIPRILRNKPSTKATITQDEEEETQRESNSLATFLITTLLLPALLVAPVERDIRIVNVVNPFYAAAAASVRASKTFDPTFSRFLTPSTSTTSSSSLPATKSIFLKEGLRSLRTIIFARHLQRIFDALPNPQIPKTDKGSSSVPIISARVQRSNIVAVSVSPGLGRVDTVSRMLNADWSLLESGSEEGLMERRFSWMGVLLYILLLPLLHVSTKSPKAAVQSILHSLFLPTPFKILSQSISDSTSEPSQKSQGDSSNSTPAKPTQQPTSLIREEVLKPGALYTECAVVSLDLSIPAPPPTETESKENSSGKGKEKGGLKEEVLQITDDGEYGGEVAGRLVWEAYEAALKVWERSSGTSKSGSSRGKKDS